MSNNKNACEAYFLNEYIENIIDIQKKATKEDAMQVPEILWFRGMDYGEHPLIPSLFRDFDLMNSTNRKDNYYESLKYAEDIRTQHYIAKNYHLYNKLPSSRIEWLEVMQHHEAKTRVMDWSESAIHSLIFAVEPFLDKKSTPQTRKHQFPCVWILNPTHLNKEIINHFSQEGSHDTLDKVLILLKDSIDDMDFIKNKIKSFNKLLETSTGFKNIEHLKYIFNLSTINDEINQLSGNLINAIKNNEYPALFFVLKKIYGDGLPLDDRNLPPLAIIQPYHTERIRSQRGVFTVFPNYKDQDGDSKLRALGFEPNAMQYNSIVKSCINKIKIMDPERIAFELLSIGMNRSSLYPEFPIISAEMESHEVY